MPYYLLRPLLQLLLIVVFLYFFGFPAVKRFQEKKVMVVSSVRDTGGIEAPAVTVDPRFASSNKGWKVNSSNELEIIEENCQGENIEHCTVWTN